MTRDGFLVGLMCCVVAFGLGVSVTLTFLTRDDVQCHRERALLEKRIPWLEAQVDIVSATNARANETFETMGARPVVVKVSR